MNRLLIVSGDALQMVRTDLPYCYCSRKKLASGKYKEYWRFRRDGRDTPLPGSPGDPQFHARYAELVHAAQEAADAESARQADRNSFEFLCRSYLNSAEFNALADVTQKDYRFTIEQRLIPILGPERFDCIDRASVKALRDSLASQPRTAHKIKQMVGRLYSWAEEEDLLPADFRNPATGIRKLKSKVVPIQVWSAEEIAHFLANCEPFMKTPVLLALYTGQRREDLVQMEWTDVMGNVVRVRQNKTGEPLDLPCHPELAKHLKKIRTPFGGAIIRTQDGKPMNAGMLSSAMNRAVAKIDGMPHRTLHGLRYASAAQLEAAGCTVVQITSVIGHRTYQMAIKYARQRRDAEAAMRKLEKHA